LDATQSALVCARPFRSVSTSNRVGCWVLLKGCVMGSAFTPDHAVGILREVIVALARRDDPSLSAHQLGVYLTCYLNSPLTKCRRFVGDTRCCQAQELLGPTFCVDEHDTRFCQHAAKDLTEAARTCAASPGAATYAIDLAWSCRAGSRGLANVIYGQLITDANVHGKNRTS
jgi:hypothetical protein